MIIKSLSRKSASYAQLLAYMEREAQEGFEIRQNMPPFIPKEDVIKSFESLGAQLPKRKNGNMLYHEILSVKREPNVDVKLQQKALFGMAYEYLRCRAPEQLAFGQIHVEDEHVHVHLMISPNGVDAPGKRKRLQKSAFREIQGQMEKWLQRTYPGLQQETVYNNEGPKFRREKKTPEREYQLEKRTKTASRKSQLIWKLQGFLKMSQSQAEFKQHLANESIEFYVRGKHPGIIVEGQKHRLATLGLKDEFDVLDTQYLQGQQAEPTPEDSRNAQRMYQVYVALKDLLMSAQSFSELGQGFETLGIRLTGTGLHVSTKDAQYALKDLGLQEIYEATLSRLGTQKSPDTTKPQARTEPKERQPEYDRIRYARRKEARQEIPIEEVNTGKNQKKADEERPLSRYEERMRQRQKNNGCKSTKVIKCN